LWLLVVPMPMEKSYHQFQHDGFGHILEEFKKRCCHLGKDIVIELSGERVMGKNVDIDHQGNLLICVNGQIQHLATGDVKLI
jgi:biotin-(acetyl-CoA carboxylase) ligase